jgi:hypothetical protein
VARRVSGSIRHEAQDEELHADESDRQGRSEDSAPGGDVGLGGRRHRPQVERLVVAQGDASSPEAAGHALGETLEVSQPEGSR